MARPGDVIKWKKEVPLRGMQSLEGSKQGRVYIGRMTGYTKQPVGQDMISRKKKGEPRTDPEVPGLLRIQTFHQSP